MRSLARFVRVCRLGRLGRLCLFCLLPLGALAIVSACNGDDSTSGSSQSGIPPASCAEPCTPGKLCYSSATSACDGTYYCWSDSKWHCAPPDSGGPGGPPPDAGSAGEDGAVESAAPVEASSGLDSPSGG